MTNIFDDLSKMGVELKQVLLANKLSKEMETEPLMTVLRKHLPEYDINNLEADAAAMKNAIDDMYNSMNQEADDAWVDSQLNAAMENCSIQQKGEYLVRMLQCSLAVMPDQVVFQTRWSELADKEVFEAQDVAELFDIVRTCISGRAGFLARQEFQVMRSSLADLPEDLVEMQLNSGKYYAQAYAAAIYITSGDNPLNAYQVGVQAAKAVESCKLLAQYHYGKARFEDVLPKLENFAKAALTCVGKAMLHMMAVGISFTLAVSVGIFVVDTLATATILSEGAILVAGLAAGALTSDIVDKDSVREALVDVWHGIRYLVSKIAAFLSGDDPGPGPGPGGSADVWVHENSVDIEEDPNMMTITI